jgi:hypothetical protein
MSRNSSPELINLVNKQFPDDVFIRLITIQWPDSTVDRYVQGFQDLTSRGQVFTAANFEIAFPQEPEDEIPTMTFNFALSERTLITKMRSFDKAPTMIMELILLSSPNIVQASFTFDVKNVKTQGLSAQVEVGFEPYLDFGVPQISYSPNIFPGLFRTVTAADFQ